MTREPFIGPLPLGYVEVVTISRSASVGPRYHVLPCRRTKQSVFVRFSAMEPEVRFNPATGNPTSSALKYRHGITRWA